MKKCAMCTTMVRNTLTYCPECKEERRLNAIKKQTEERKARTRASRLAEKTSGLPKWMLERGEIRPHSVGSHFG